MSNIEPLFYTKQIIKNFVIKKISFNNLNYLDIKKISSSLSLDLNKRKSRQNFIFFKNEKLIRSIFFSYESEVWGLETAVHNLKNANNFKISA